MSDSNTTVKQVEPTDEELAAQIRATADRLGEMLGRLEARGWYTTIEFFRDDCDKWQRRVSIHKTVSL